MLMVNPWSIIVEQDTPAMVLLKKTCFPMMEDQFFGRTHTGRDTSSKKYLESLFHYPCMSSAEKHSISE
jgi:hypothetical protein